MASSWKFTPEPHAHHHHNSKIHLTGYPHIFTNLTSLLLRFNLPRATPTLEDSMAPIPESPLLPVTQAHSAFHRRPSMLRGMTLQKAYQPCSGQANRRYWVYPFFNLP